jgi:P-type Cu2+ transporter
MNDLAIDNQLMDDLTLSVIVPDIHCAACTFSIEKALRSNALITDVRTNLANRRVTVDYRPELDASEVTALITDVGFNVTPDVPPADLIRVERKALLSRVGVAGIGMVQVMMFALTDYLAGEGELDVAYQMLFRWASFAVAVPVALYCALPFYQSAVRDIGNGYAGMDVPVSLAILSAFLLSVYSTLTGGDEVYFDTVCMFTFFLLVGRFLELEARRRYQTDQYLIDHLLPRQARRLNGEMAEVEDLVGGDRVVVLAGESIPVDGEIIAGISSIDESAFSGEVIPVDKVSGSRVYAGSRNVDGKIEVEMTTAPEAFAIRNLERMYVQAGAHKPAFVSMSDNVARYFVAMVLCLAAASGLYWWLEGTESWFVVMLTVLVVSCPCALSLATPVAYTVALSTLRKAGLVVASGTFLERLARVRHLFVDKTGTLTLGNLEMVDVVSLDHSHKQGSDVADRARQIAKALQKVSHHPVARAFDTIASTISVSRPWVTPGKGVGGEIDGIRYFIGSTDLQPPESSGYWILLTENDRPHTWFRLQDQLRSDSSDLIGEMHALGKKVSVLTGDASAFGIATLASLAVDRVHHGLAPQDKANIVGQAQRDDEMVLMVGDGINDTLAMAGADVSIAVSPVDISIQTAADAVLLNGDLTLISSVCRYANRFRRVIRQNMTWAVGYNICVIPLAVAGILSPWMAALGMSFSSLVVVANSNRLIWLGR